MQSIINAPTILAISVIVLFGWLISDFRINDAVEVAIISTINDGVYPAKRIAIVPATSTPNIDTNWFSAGSSGMAFQLPSSQAKKGDDDDRAAVGGAMGESFSNNDDL